jgi:hypothetical protein
MPTKLWPTRMPRQQAASAIFKIPQFYEGTLECRCKGTDVNSSAPLPDLVLAHDGSNTMNYATALLLPRRNIAVLVVTNQGTVGGPGQKGCQEACDLLLRAFVTKSPTG